LTTTSDGQLKLKAQYTLLKMGYLSYYLNGEAMKNVIMSHFFGMIYYGSLVWLTETLSSWGWNLLNVLHYTKLSEWHVQTTEEEGAEIILIQLSKEPAHTSG